MYATINAKDVTTVGTVQEYPLGAVASIPATHTGSFANMGVRSFVYIYNDSGATLAAYKMVQRKAATEEYHGKIANVVERGLGCLGVPQAAIANLSYGWSQIFGPAEWYGDIGADHADAPIQCDASALADANGGTAVAGRVVGWGIDAGDAASSVLVTVMLTCW